MIRNVTFAVLCASVFLFPQVAQAGGDCWADYAYTDFGWPYGDHYQGMCQTCDNDSWYYAISVCADEGEVMVEYFCAEYHYEFVCTQLYPY